jgi:hypothetical protein
VPIGFVAGALVLWLARPTSFSLVAGLIVASIGEALRVWAAGHLNKSREVTASGPYRWFAHPLYVGSSVIGLGLAVASAAPVAAIVIAAYLASTIGAAVRTEDAFLRRTFGDGYDRYRRGERPGAQRGRHFSMRRAVANGEHRAIAGLVLAALLLALKATYNGLFWRTSGRLPEMADWVALGHLP